MKVFTILVALFLAGGAFAQQATVPPRISGYGTLSVSNSSVLLSTMTVGPNSKVWPPNQIPMIFVSNASDSAGIAYVCPLGGTCSSTVGIPIPTGGAYGFAGASSSMTVIAASSATVIAQW